MATTVKSIKSGKTWTFYDKPHEFFDSKTGWEGLRMTIDDAFEVIAEHNAAREATDCMHRNMAEHNAAYALYDKAEANWQVAWRAINADIYALARAMEREGWGTYMQAIKRVEGYYRTCFHDKFGK